MKKEASYGLLAHLARFDTNQKCQDYLIQVRWGGKPQCPKCGNKHMNYYISTRNIYTCSDCSKQFSVTQGTIFHRSKVPLTKWFMAIYLFTTKKRGVSSCQMAKWLEVKQHTAWYMLHRLREALIDENEIVLSGIVEADETFVGPEIQRDLRLVIAKRKHDKEQNRLQNYSENKRLKMGIKKKRGRKKGSTKEVLQQKKIERGGTPYYSHENRSSERIPFETGVLILGMMEEKGRAVMKILGRSKMDVTKKKIFPLLRKHVTQNSILITDQLNLYSGTSKFFTEHLSVNHDKGYVIDGIHINNIENAWMHLKKMIDGTYFHLSYHHFEKYLNENTYRWNRRKESERNIFDSFIPLVAGKIITYKKMIAKGQDKQAA